MQRSKHALTQQQTEISQVVPPSTRAIYIFSNQLVHDIRADAEELGLAVASTLAVRLNRSRTMTRRSRVQVSQYTSAYCIKHGWLAVCVW